MTRNFGVQRPLLGVSCTTVYYTLVNPRTRATTQEIYDLAWSPTSEYILSGSTDNTARIFNVADGTFLPTTSRRRLSSDVPSAGVCVREIAEHNHYVQGVAWDPMNEYIATQSSDRCVWHDVDCCTGRGSAVRSRLPILKPFGGRLLKEVSRLSGS
jgi:WD40 repeat protein